VGKSTTRQPTPGAWEVESHTLGSLAHPYPHREVAPQAPEGRHRYRPQSCSSVGFADTSP